MSAADLLALSPLLILAATPLLAMLLLAFVRSRRATAAITVVGLAAAGVVAPLVAAGRPHEVTSLLVVDGYSLFYIALLCAAGIAIALIAYDYWPPRALLPEEFYVLLVLAVFGSAVLVSSTHFASLFLGLETLSVSLYAMIGYRRTDVLSLEAALKYLILAGVSAAFLLFGMALIYAEVGGLSYAALAVGGAGATATLAAGVCMVLVGFGFKLALVPFHMWTPDVYQGAPVPAAAFVATASKGAVLALLIRFFVLGGLFAWPQMTGLLSAVAVASMLTGNLLALRQTNVKRLLAYSSIAHMGYLMVALVAGGALGIAAVAFYLVAYFVSMIGAFGAVAAVSGDRQDADQLFDYHGLAWRRPWLSAVLSVMLFSLAGIPLTAGFVGKFYILAAGVGTSRWVLAIVLAVNSAISLYYYLRIIVTMYRGFEPRRDEKFKTEPPLWRYAGYLSTSAALAGLSLSLLWLGIHPAPLIELVQTIAAGLM
jgi:NADH-quinone oxidoreductase subunit N